MLMLAMTAFAGKVKTGCPQDGEVVRYRTETVRVRPNQPESSFAAVYAIHAKHIDKTTVELSVVTESVEPGAMPEGPLGDFMKGLFARTRDFPPPRARVTWNKDGNVVEVVNLEEQAASMKPVVSELVANLRAELDPAVDAQMAGVWATLEERALAPEGLERPTLELLLPMVSYSCGAYPVGVTDSDTSYPSPFGPGPELPGKATITVKKQGKGLQVEMVETLADLDVWAVLGPLLEGMGMTRDALPPDTPMLTIDARTEYSVGKDGWPTKWTQTKEATALQQVSKDDRSITRLD